jgi:deazaflavin-dependent oxidoreductase (nitroreductase family)
MVDDMTDTFDFDGMNRKVITEFRENSGKVGGLFAGKRLALVHHTGAKSGVERIAPLLYHPDGDRIFIFASKGGSDENPAWYHNLVANPKITVELGTETFAAIARVITGAERDTIYATNAALEPQFADYERRTNRVIPVVELVRA